MHLVWNGQPGARQPSFISIPKLAQKCCPVGVIDRQPSTRRWSDRRLADAWYSALGRPLPADRGWRSEEDCKISCGGRRDQSIDLLGRANRTSILPLSLVYPACLLLHSPCNPPSYRRSRSFTALPAIQQSTATDTLRPSIPFRNVMNWLRMLHAKRRASCSLAAVVRLASRGS